MFASSHQCRRRRRRPARTASRPHVSRRLGELLSRTRQRHRSRADRRDFRAQGASREVALTVTDLGKLLARVADVVAEDRVAFETTRVAPDVSVEQMRAALDGHLPQYPTDDETIIDEFVAAARPGLVASPGPRY